ncbi:hypothetical protein B0H14DRAFT_2609410 [Mycena olivaceomarginata]|nr:hypothetical protein B0H14DRAFT_2609410 [Mycena olivaceomarginata]
MTRQRPCPPARKRTRRRTKAEIRELGRIRRLKPGPQRDLLLGLKDGNVVPYLDEGEGCVYFTGVLQKKAIQELHPKELPRQMIVKWGTARIPRLRGRADSGLVLRIQGRASPSRRADYTLAAARRRVRARQVRRTLPVHPRHREYHYMHPGGSLEEIERLAVESFEEMGEQNIACQILRPRRRCAKYAVGLLKFGRS